MGQLFLVLAFIHYLVMERGEIVQRGLGADMDRDGVKQLLWA